MMIISESEKLERLQHNDPRLTIADFWLQSDTNLEELTQALKRNSFLQSVGILYTYKHDLLSEPITSSARIDHDSPYQNKSNREALLNFWETLGKIPTLRRISITGPASRMCAFDVSNLALLLNYAHQCTMLCIGRVNVKGNENDFHELAAAIQQHPKLQEVCLSGNILFGGEDSVAGGQETLAKALSMTPTLRTVQLSGIGIAREPRLTKQSLKLLFLSPYLKKLHLYDFSLTDEDIIVMEQTTLLNKTVCHLKELRLSCCELGASGMYALSRLLSNTKSLEILHLWVSHFREMQGSIDVSYGALANALGRSPIRDVRIITAPKEQNMIFSPESQQMFCRMLHDNYCLEYLRVPCLPRYQREINFYLKLNNLGRRRLLSIQQDHNLSLYTEKKEWMNALIASRHDIRCLYHFLSMNPSICQ